MTSHEDTDAVEKNIMALLEQMTLEEKVSLLSGADFWSVNGVERLGIPPLSVSDGPTGLRSINSDPATVFPVGVCVAASWDKPLVEEMSAAIAREAISYGVDVLLAPAINIQRTPLGGRNFETYSEDPHLAAEIGNAYVHGVQSEGVGVSLKHYVANNQEHERMRGSSNVSERALREIYLSAFEPVIKTAKPWTVMAAYNRINGIFACEHDELLNKVLKQEWGYDGVVVSDWMATKSTVMSANGGLDLEMPGPGIWFGDALVKEVHDGTVSEQVINDHALRMLRLFQRCSLLDSSPKARQGELSSERHRNLARKTASAGIVLLKNDRDLLPLKGVKRVAILGAAADAPTIQGGGSSQVSPDRIVTPLEGLRQTLGHAVDFKFHRAFDHEPRPPALDGRLLRPRENDNAQGLHAKYFSSPDYEGDIVHEDIDWRFSKLGFGAKAMGDAQEFSVEWSGIITPRYTGSHTFCLTHSGPEVELIIDGKTLIGSNTPRDTELLFMIIPLQKRDAEIELEAEKPYPITIRYSQPAGTSIPGFNIFNAAMRQPEPDYDEAMEIARQSDCAIVFVGSGTTSETEGNDRQSMALNPKQNQLVRDCLEVNPKTIVVCNTGAPVEMPWADAVPAILQTWLPGQEGGLALADILCGRENPSGKLPVTFPRRYEDNPTYPFFPGGLQADYGEGIFVGYRYYDKVDLNPLFPFGHGLSYTGFELTNISAPPTATVGEDITVSVQIENTGDLAGAQIVQLYIQDLATREAMPVRQLKAFEKVYLEPGETQMVQFTLLPRAFSWFNPDIQDWEVSSGEYRIYIGYSSRDLPIATSVKLEKSNP